MKFKRKRNAFQKAMANAVKASTVRFDEPWGMVCLFWAGGSPNTAYAKNVSKAQGGAGRSSGSRRCECLKTPVERLPRGDSFRPSLDCPLIWLDS
jgi:hypothetical protein